MRVGILYSRVRAEEKLLFEAFRQRGAEFDLLDDRKLIFDISGGETRQRALTITMSLSSAVSIMGGRW